MLCVATAGTVIALSVSSFTLSWSHSVEHTRWDETWRVAGQGLQVTAARVRGSGAGIDLPPDAVWTEDGWTYTPHVPPLRQLSLAASGQTGGGWQLCAGGACMELGAVASQPAVLTAGPHCPGQGAMEK